MNVADKWGAERNEWLVNLSWGIAISAATLFVLVGLFVFRVPLFRLLDKPFSYTRPFWRLLAILVAMIPPARTAFRRYLYTGRHLQTA